MSWQSHDLSGLEKASVLISILGAEASARVFDKLTAEERELLGAQIAKLHPIDAETRDRVLYEFSRRMRVAASETAVEEKNGEERTDTPFAWLEAMDSDEVADVLSGERAQNIALILAHLSPKGAAAVLMRLTDTMKNEVSLRLASMKPVSRETVDAVEKSVRLRISRAKDGSGQSRGGDSLMKLLGDATNRVRESLIGTQSRGMQSSVEPRIAQSSTPEDMLRLTDSQIKAALQHITLDDLCLALTVASDDLRATVLNNVSNEAGTVILQRVGSPGPTKVSDIEQAQARISAVLSTTAARGLAMGTGDSTVV